MANILQNFLGGGKAATPDAAVPSADSDFADFVEAPEPAPTPLDFVETSDSTPPLARSTTAARPYTKWYNVHERYSLSDFRVEGYIFGVLVALLAIHLLGSRKNRSKAKAWARANGPLLKKEFALVGFSGVPTLDSDPADNDGLMKEKSLFEFQAYATGRQNVAFVDVNLNLQNRFNLMANLSEHVLGFFVESMEQPSDLMEAVIYPFDGKESKTVPGLPGASEIRTHDSKSSYDGFVWSVVHKEHMKTVRDNRYDMSITFTKDNAKLPPVFTVMSESAEVTENMLTPELVQAIETAGDLFHYLIVSDQPVDKPTKLDETVPRKRIFLRYSLPSNDDYTPLLPLFSYFLSLPDRLVSTAHFRPEVLRKIRNVREETIAQIKKADEVLKAEERTIERDKVRKAKRDEELKSMDAKAQKKFLEKEREKEMRKAQKRGTVRA